MGLFRPATPGFLVTLIATILLLVVSFSVPWFKNVYFLKAAVSEGNQSGFITFGVLGYCTSINNGTLNCTKAKLGYRFDANELLGNDIKFLQIPSVVTSWITWALVLHIVALVIAAISTLFGLLAHVREMSMSCLSTCVSGFAASVALLAFIFDLVLFFTARVRINAIDGGSAQIGNAIWLTLAAWVLLFFSGCFYAVGRCCMSNRPRVPGNSGSKWGWGHAESQKDTYAEQMRLDAVKAEADRKARQARPEVGLPAFPGGHDERKPLSSNYEPAYLEEEVPLNPYKDHSISPAPVVGRPAGPRATPVRQGTGHSGTPSDSSANGHGYGNAAYASGYTPGQQGRRTIDQYNAQSPPPQNTYPPQSPPTRQPTMPSEYEPRHDRYNYGQPSHTEYPSHSYADTYSSAVALGAGATAAGAAAGAYGASRVQSPPVNQNQYLEPSAAPYGHNQYPTGSTQDYGHGYGHSQDNSAYYSAVSHGQGNSQWDRPTEYAAPQPQTSYGNDYAAQHSPTTYGGYGEPRRQGSIPVPASSYPSYPAASYPQPSTATPPPTQQYYSSPQQSQQSLSYDPYNSQSNLSGTPPLAGGGTYYQSNQYQSTGAYVPGGLHPVQEASNSTDDGGLPPQYSRGVNPPPAGWAQKS